MKGCGKGHFGFFISMLLYIKPHTCKEQFICKKHFRMNLEALQEFSKSWSETVQFKQTDL